MNTHETVKIKPARIPFKCPSCSGWGTVGYAKKICVSCNGKGVILVDQEKKEDELIVYE